MRVLTVYQIVLQHLEGRPEVDGLYNESAECACLTEDLAPCGAMSQDCEVGIKRPCPPECGDHDWHIDPLPHYENEREEYDSQQTETID